MLLVPLCPCGRTLPFRRVWVGSLPKSRDPHWVRIINNPDTVMCWERGQCGFCPLPFLAISLHTALSAWATPRTLMFLSRRSARSGSCPLSKLQGHLNSFPALASQSEATKMERIVPRLRTFLVLPRAMLLSIGAAEVLPQQKKSVATWWQGASFHLNCSRNSGNSKPPPISCGASLVLATTL